MTEWIGNKQTYIHTYMSNYISNVMAPEVVKSNRFDFLAMIEDEVIPTIVKDIRDSIESDYSLYSIKDLSVDEIREKEMDNLIDWSIINFSNTAYYGKVSYNGVEIQIAELLALRSYYLYEIWDEIWYDKPIGGGWVRELVYKFTDKVDAQSNNGSYNTVYKISNDRLDNQPIGYLYDYENHLYDVMTYGATYTKQYCHDLKDGMMIGYVPECGIGNYEDANNNRKLFHEFLKRYMGGEFKYRKSLHHSSKPKYYHELPDLTQRNIKRVVDTLNEIYNG